VAVRAQQVPETGDCPRCGFAYAPYQEYCLACGLRLPAEPGFGDALAAAAGRHSAWSPGDWVWPVAALLVVAVLATAAVLALRSTRDEAPPGLVVATTAVGAEVATAPVSGLPSGTAESSPTLPEEQIVTEKQPATTNPPVSSTAAKSRVEWPADAGGFTVVLASVPRRSRAAAVAKAKEAADAGVKEVGVIDSSQFSSLHPGYLVIFSGVFETRSQAEAAIATARARGYNDAYAAEVAR
jgi:hypothetical protein